MPSSVSKRPNRLRPKKQRPASEWLTRAQVVEVANVSMSTVERWCRVVDGNPPLLKWSKVGKLALIHRDDLAAFLESRAVC